MLTKKIELEPGEVICSKCGGEGPCSKCHGRKKLDWIENVVGVKSIRLKPGIYVQEVDLSEYIPRRPSLLEDGNLRKGEQKRR